MNLSAVIVNWNSADYLRALLASLAPLKEEIREVWVVDNASGDGSLDRAGEFPWVRALRLPENRGFAGAANEGIARACSDFILLLNPDVELFPETVRRLHCEIQKRPRAGLVCGALRDRDGGSQEYFQIRPFPTWKSVLCDVLFIDELRMWMGIRPKRARLSGREDSRQTETGCRVLESEQPAAAFWMLRKQSWVDIGGFDTRFSPAWFEDVDFCKRLAQGPWEILYFPDLPVIHRGGLALDRLGYRAFVRIFYGNLLEYLRKHHPAAYPFLWLPVLCGMWSRWLLIRR